MKLISITLSEGHTRWRLCRPERGNGLGPSMAAALHQAAGSLPRDRPLVITAEPMGQGAQATWIAGGDLRELAALAAPAARDYAESMSSLCRFLAELPIPVIAAIDGAAIGGGAELSLWCDHRLATQRSSLHFKHLAAGLPLGYGSTSRLVAMVGLARAQTWLLDARQIAADEAHALGLVQSLCADTEALESLIASCLGRYRQLSPEAYAAQKAMFQASLQLYPAAREAHDLERFAATWGNPHQRSFLERFGKT